MSEQQDEPRRTVADMRGPNGSKPNGNHAHHAPRPRALPPPERVAPEADIPKVDIGFDNLQSWEFTQRVARALASSTMVPTQYRMLVPRKRNKEELEENPNAIPNCIVALNMAKRIGFDVLTVMQNLDVVEGHPSWRGAFVIGAINASPMFEHELQFDFAEDGEIEVERVWSEYDHGNKTTKRERLKVRNIKCVAWTTSAKTGRRIESAPVTMKLAVEEGWYSKPGSKWQTMPEQMFMYRAGAFFGRAHAPHLLMGLHTVEERRDILDAEEAEDGAWTVRDDIEGKRASPVAGDDRSEPDTPSAAWAAANAQAPAQQIEHEQTIQVEIATRNPAEMAMAKLDDLGFGDAE